MTWLLVVIVLHVGGDSDQFKVPGFHTARDCFDTGNAWRAQMLRRENAADVVIVRCELR